MDPIRSAIVVSAAVLAGTIALAAPAAPPQPPAGTTTARTWTDADLERLMKEVGATVGVLRKSVEGQNAELTRQHAEKLKSLFGDVNDFWSARNVREAASTANAAAAHTDRVEDAAEAKDFTKAAEHLKLLQGTCANCHGKFRDKGPDGTFRIKP